MLFGSPVFQKAKLGVEPLIPPFQNVIPGSGPVIHFPTPSVCSSLPPIHPAPAACSPESIASSIEVMVAK